MTKSAPRTVATPADDPHVRQVVLRAWRETLPGEEPDLDVSWEDAGADSLKSLQLMMRIEELLGRPAPIELLTADATPAVLAARLAADGGPGDRDDDRPTVLLVPGLYGDVPRLADFRRRSAGRIDFDLVPLPGLEQPMGVLGDIGATARLATNRLLPTLDADEPVTIAGWSFGGTVALEIARRLRAEGRNVGLLVILDTIIAQSDMPMPPDGEPAVAQQHQAARNMMRKRPRMRWLPGAARPLRDEDVLGYANRMAFGLLLRLGRVEAARRVHRMSAVSPAIAYRRHKLLTGGVRMRALPGWYARCEPLRMPTLLIVTDDGRRADSEAKWRRLCPDLEVVELGGGHFDLLDEPRADRCVSTIIEAMRKAAGARGEASPVRVAA